MHNRTKVKPAQNRLVPFGIGRSILNALSCCVVSTMWVPIGPAMAADISAMEDQEAARAIPSPQQWQFTVAPYVWASGVAGDLSYRGIPAVHLEAPFSDLLKDLNFGGMLVGEARYDRFVLFSDLIDLNLSREVRPSSLPVEIDVGINLFEWTPMVGYSVIKTDDWNLDVMVGARVWAVDLDTTLAVGSALSATVDESEVWVDAMVGVKSQYALTSNLFLAGWALAGSGGSTFTWDLLGSVGYKFTDSIWAMAGYRAQGVDYESGPFKFDTTMQGPVVGATFKF
jgi:hypothetical protein